VDNLHDFVEVLAVDHQFVKEEVQLVVDRWPLNNVVDLDLNSVLEMKLVDFDQLSVVDTVDSDQQLDFEIADFDQQGPDFVVADAAAVEIVDFDQQPDFVEVAEDVEIVDFDQQLDFVEVAEAVEVAHFDQEEGLVVELVAEMLED